MKNFLYMISTSYILGVDCIHFSINKTEKKFTKNMQIGRPWLHCPEDRSGKKEKDAPLLVHPPFVSFDQIRINSLCCEFNSFGFKPNSLLS
ncbi:hypothetical protein H7T43_10640 [Peribacillus simplex]|nr:hypothetical protein [Peribacillus simplex]